MINIAIAKKYKNLVDLEQLQLAAQTVLNILRPSVEYELTIAVEDDANVQKLNKQFRQIDSTTDVLSFEANDLNPESGLLYLGDSCHSVPLVVVERQPGVVVALHAENMMVADPGQHLTCTGSDRSRALCPRWLPECRCCCGYRKGPGFHIS